ncbi:hypothetical protein [Stappia phage SI01]|uniref:Internal virion protein n=1 Tax=Stappia phage SI01 TaxID=2847766 RepID=A0AAE7VH41_9CAUD|nr:hypothetical protein [Stappia phage SI01]
MWMQMGINVLNSAGGFLRASRDAAYKRKLQEYNNQMTRLANAQNQNAVTTNQNLAVERSLSQQFEIERSEYTTVGKAEVAAAAADTAGRSVNQTIYQIHRSADEAESKRLADLDAQLAQFRHQRLNSSIQTQQQIDHSYIPSPNPVAALLGLGGELAQTYQRYNPRVM